MSPEIIVKFLKSSSQYFPEIISLCSNFPCFTKPEKKGEYYILATNISEIKERVNSFGSICERLASWKSTKYFLGADEIKQYSFMKFRSVLQCCSNSKKRPRINEFCDYCNTGWGCRYLDDILLTDDGYSFMDSGKVYWFNYGFYDTNGIWHIDKDRIKKSLEQEIKDKLLGMCDMFQSDNVDRIINGFPDEIDIDASDTWERTYENLPVGVFAQQKAVGIRIKKNVTEEYENNGNFSFHLGIDHQAEENDSSTRVVPDTTFNCIGGIQEILQTIREVIELPILAPEVFKHFGTAPHKGILLYGPPGCGKTLIAKAIANEVSAHFIAINGPEILNKYLGESENNLRKIFNEAKLHQPSIIYFDEFDAIATIRNISDNGMLTNSIVNQLLTLMDGTNKYGQVCIIASTNQPNLIEPALLRPGRFDYHLKIDKPTLEGCIEIFNIHTKAVPCDDEFDKARFAQKNLLGFTGAEIAYVVNEAVFCCCRRVIDFEAVVSDKDSSNIDYSNLIVSESDFYKALEGIQDKRRKDNNHISYD